MNTSEAKKWLDYHNAAFPGVVDWLSRNPGTWDAWSRTLDGVTLEAAKAATDSLHRGDVEPPQGFTRHAGVVRQLARQTFHLSEIAPKHDWDCRSFSCSRCRDFGCFEVFATSTMRAAAAGELQRDGTPGDLVRTCNVACTCSNGSVRESRGMLAFDERCMVPAGWVFKYQERFDRLFAFIKNWEDSKYEPAFREFNDR